MKKFLIAGLLLTACVSTTTELFARTATVVGLGVPPNVRAAFATLEAEYASNGKVLANPVWSHNQGVYTVCFVVVDIAGSDNGYCSLGASFKGNGQRVY